MTGYARECDREEHEARERDDLIRSPIACAVADAWADQCVDVIDRGEPSSALIASLNAIEIATRPSSLRKVRQ